MQPKQKPTRLPRMWAIFFLCGLMAGCDGKAETIYSPPNFGDPAHPPAVRIIVPADGAKFHAHADIRLLALVTPHGTDLGPIDNKVIKKFTDPDKWTLTQSPEDWVSVEFLAGTNRLGSQTSGMVLARVKSKPGQAEPMFMVNVGSNPVNVTVLP